MTTKVRWEADGELQEREPSDKKFDWVGKRHYTGSVAGAMHHYLKLEEEVQARCDLFVAEGVVEGCGGIIFGDELKTLAMRPDLPEVS